MTRPDAGVTAASASTIGSSASGRTCLKSSPVSGIWTSGPAAHSPRQPTRLTATSVIAGVGDLGAESGEDSCDPVDRQLTASQTYADARTVPDGTTRLDAASP